MNKTIFLNKDVEVLVTSFGGVGTTFLMEAIGKFKRVNSPENKDGFKHLPVPPISFNKSLKVIYIYGDPKMACLSLFRRKYHHTQSVQAQKYMDKGFIIPFDMSLEEYLQQGMDGHHFEQHFTNWYDRYKPYSVLFIRYEEIHNNLERLAAYVGLPTDFISGFPPKKSRKSHLSKLNNEMKQSLDKLYEKFTNRLNEIEPIHISTGHWSTYFTKKIYYVGLLHSLSKKWSLRSLLRNRK